MCPSEGHIHINFSQKQSVPRNTLEGQVVTISQKGLTFFSISCKLLVDNSIKQIKKHPPNGELALPN